MKKTKKNEEKKVEEVPETPEPQTQGDETMMTYDQMMLKLSRIVDTQFWPLLKTFLINERVQRASLYDTLNPMTDAVAIARNQGYRNFSAHQENEIMRFYNNYKQIESGINPEEADASVNYGNF